MAKKYEIYKQGKDLYIVCRNADKSCLNLISQLLELEDVKTKEVPDVLPLKEQEISVPNTEEMEPVMPENKSEQKSEKEQETKKEIVVIKYGPYAGIRPLEVMIKEGPKALAEMYQLFGKLKKDESGKKTLKIQIKEDIREYVFLICKSGFQADNYSLTETKEILIRNEKEVFPEEISQILKQAGVKDLKTFVETSDEVMLKGALSACMNSLYKRVSSQ